MKLSIASIVLLGFISSAAALAQPPAAAGGGISYSIKPSTIDPQVHQFDDENLVLSNENLPADARLVVFLPGTGEKPADAATLLNFVAGLGYRVIGLEYDNKPAVAEVCPDHPQPGCPMNFRNMRVYGEGPPDPVQNAPAEAIVNRLVSLLTYLNTQHPNEHWRQYLGPAGHKPNWSAIVISGFSQGAGMAAYIAKKEAVARAVCFSGPSDTIGHTSTLAHWITDPGVTPPARWFAEYHKREMAAAILPQAYAAIKIPSANIQVLDQDIPGNAHPSALAFHVSTRSLTSYEPQWRAMFGKP